MPSTVTSKSSVTINAPIAKVWAAVTTPALIKQWFYGVDTETDWQVGSPIVHKGEWQGKPYQDKGNILQIAPPKLLGYSHWSPMSGLPDSPENYENITFSLSEKDGTTELTISELNLPGEQAKTLSEQVWKSVLNTLKELLEK